MKLNLFAGAALLALFETGHCQSVVGSKYNNPTAGPPASFFAATSTLPVAALQTAAAQASQAAVDATYPVTDGKNAAVVTIHQDWSQFSEVRFHLCNVEVLGAC